MSLTRTQRRAMRKQQRLGARRHKVFMCKLHPDRYTPLKRWLLLSPIYNWGLWVKR